MVSVRGVPLIGPHHCDQNRSGNDPKPFLLPSMSNPAARTIGPMSPHPIHAINSLQIKIIDEANRAARIHVQSSLNETRRGLKLVQNVFFRSNQIFKMSHLFIQGQGLRQTTRFT